MARARSSRHRPPILAILFLLGFLFVMLYFIAAQQLRNAEIQRLRLLASFSDRIETIVEDIGVRFIRLARSESDRDSLRQYVEQIPNLEFVDKKSGKDLVEAETPGRQELRLKTVGPKLYLTFSGCRDPEATDDAGISTLSEECESPTETENGRWQEVRARLDLAAILGPLLLPQGFDSIAVATRDGRVLFQGGEPELQLEDLSAIIEAERADAARREGLVALIAPSSRKMRAGIHSDGEEILNPASGALEMRIAGIDYQLFLQPITPHMPQLGEESSQQPQSWVVCGFVARDRLLSASFTSSPILLVVLLSIFPLGVLAWPFLKFVLVSSRQRLRRRDAAILVLSSFLVCILGVLVVLDWDLYRQQRQTVEAQLRTLSEKIREGFRSEIGDIYQVLARLQGCREDLETVTHQAVMPGRSRSRVDPEDKWPQEFQRFLDKIEGKILATGCGIGEKGMIDRYPIFHSVFWMDKYGGQHQKWPRRQHSIRRPNLSDRDYFLCAGRKREPFRLDWLAKAPSDGVPPEICLASVISNTGGADQAVIALPLEEEVAPPDDWGEAKRPKPSVASTEKHLAIAMATRLASLNQVVLPKEFSFAVVDTSIPGSARVLFHSEPQRILTEDLIKASDENSVLKSILRERRKGSLTLSYWGSRHRAFTAPVEGTPWMLVTFRETQDLWMRNIEAIYDFFNPIFLLILLFSMLILMFLLTRKGSEFLWPDHRHLGWYHGMLALAILASGLFTALLARETADFPQFSVDFLSLILILVGIVFGLFLVFFLCRKTPGSAILSGKGSRPPRIPSIRLLAEFFSSLQAYSASTSPQGKVRHRGALKGRLPAVVFLMLRGLALGTGIFLALYGCWRALTVPVALTAGGTILMAACNWFFRDRFFGYQRRWAHILAGGALLYLLAVLPSIAFFQLASGRQQTFMTQDRQRGLFESLAEKRWQTLEHPRRAQGDYVHYARRLEGFWESQSGAIGIEARHESWPASCSESRTWPWGGPGSRLFSQRPVPLNDLTARPTGVDLSRYQDSRGKWRFLGRQLAGCMQDGWQGGGPWILRSSSPVATNPAWGPLDLERIFWGLIALLSLGVPFLLLWFISDRILLGHLVDISPIGSQAEDTTGESEERQRVSRAGDDPAAFIDRANLARLLDPDTLKRTNTEQKRILLVTAVPELVVRVIRQKKWTLEIKPFYDFGQQQAGGEAPETPELDSDGAEQIDEVSKKDTEVSGLEEQAVEVSEADEQASDSEGPGAVESGPVPLLITAFNPKLDAGDPRAWDQARDFERLIRDNERPIVVVTDKDPRSLLGLALDEHNEDETSQAAILRRFWAVLLSAFVLRFAADRGDKERWMKWLKVKAQQLKGLYQHSDSGEGTLWRRLSSVGPRLLLPAASAGYQDARKVLTVLQRECSGTRYLQTIGKEILQETRIEAFEALSVKRIVRTIGQRARPYYQALWASTSEEEQVVLAQLATEGLVNPQNHQIVMNLMNRGLIVRTPELKLMNESFTLFVEEMVPRERILEWESKEVANIWTILRWLMPIPLLLFGGFLFVTQRGAVSNAIGLLLAAASIGPTVANMFGYFGLRAARRSTGGGGGQASKQGDGK